MIKKTGDLNQEEVLFRLLAPVGQARRLHRAIWLLDRRQDGPNRQECLILLAIPA